jgi:hypothetical protein
MADEVKVYGGRHVKKNTLTVFEQSLSGSPSKKCGQRGGYYIEDKLLVFFN